MTQSTRERVLWSAVLVLLILALALPALHQPASYHAFADERSMLGVPRALDTLSNLPFLVFGLWGLWQLRSVRGLSAAQRRVTALFFAGLLATAAGSGWYHLSPDDARLVWDRAGMTPSFAGIIGLAVTQRVSDRSALLLAVAALLLGWLAIAVWSKTGNLTPWAVLQGGGVLLILGLLALPAHPGASALHINWLFVVGVYALAKIAETFDIQIFAINGLISGHSLKHLLASLAALPVIAALNRTGTS